MIDFLKAHPFVSKEEYLWEWTIPQIRLANYDFTHILYLSEEQAKKINATIETSPDSLISDLGAMVL